MGLVHNWGDVLWPTHTSRQQCAKILCRFDLTYDGIIQLIEADRWCVRRPWSANVWYVAFINTKTHPPALSPEGQGMEVTLELNLVSLVVYRAVQEAIVCKQVDCHVRVSHAWEVVNMAQVKQGSQHCALGYPWENLVLPWAAAIHHHRLGPSSQEGPDPEEDVPLDAIMLEFLEKAFMWHIIDRLAKSSTRTSTSCLRSKLDKKAWVVDSSCN